MAKLSLPVNWATLPILHWRMKSNTYRVLPRLIVRKQKWSWLREIYGYQLDQSENTHRWGEESLYGWYPVLQIWIQLIYDKHKTTYFLFWSSPPDLLYSDPSPNCECSLNHNCTDVIVSMFSACFCWVSKIQILHDLNFQQWVTFRWMEVLHYKITFPSK